MKSVKQFKAWLTRQIAALEGGEDFNESNWDDAHGLIDEAREYAFKLKLPAAAAAAKLGPPRQRLAEIYNACCEVPDNLEYLTVEQAAKKFNIGKRTVYRLVDRGLKATRIEGTIRILVSDLRRYLKERASALD